MIINKVKPFYTAELNAALAENSAQLNALLESLKMDREGSPESTRDSYAKGRERLAELKKLYDIQNEIHAAAEQAYIDHFFGDVDAILSDVREIVNAIDKEEYISWQKKTTDDCKKLLAVVELQKEDKQKKENIKELKQLATRGYQNCYYFILVRIRVQLNALNFYKSETGTQQAISIVETKASSYYSKPKGAKPERKPTEEIIRQYEPDISSRDEFLQMGFGPVSELMLMALGGDPGSLPKRRKRFNRGTTISVISEDDGIAITSKSKNHEITIAFNDIMKLVKGNPMAKKILMKILVNAREWDNEVQFPLNELIGEGMYSNMDTARKGFNNIGRNILTSLKVCGEVNTGRKKILQEGDTTVVFIKAHVTKSVCHVYLSPYINWDFIAPYRAAIPAYYFNLPNRPADLLYLIFITARQRSKEIAEQGYFSISYKSIQYHLNLPDETKTKNPKRDIKDEIERAIEQIEEKNREYARPLQAGEDPDFSLLPQADYDAPIAEYLNEGKLLVFMKGNYAKNSLEIRQKTTARIEKNRKQKEKIDEEAQIRTRVKQLENLKN